MAQNMVSRSDPMEACLQRRTIETFNHVFSHKVIFKFSRKNRTDIFASAWFCAKFQS